MYDHRTNPTDDPCTDFTYDNLDRLTAAEYSIDDTNEAFTIDDLGNRTNINMRDGNDITYTVDDLTNRYTSIADANLTYDAAGNLTKDQRGYEYEYDYENRIVKITKAGNDIAEFAYDALGRRIRKIDSVASETTLYYHNYKWQALCQYDENGAIKEIFVYGNYIDEVLFRPAFIYYVHDHLYSPVAITHSGGTVLERYEYDAYGNPYILDAQYAPRTTSNYGNPFYFTGRRLDFLDSVSLKIMYYRNRFYDTYTGRFITHDPWGIKPNMQSDNIFNPSLLYSSGLCLYEYVNSRPTISLDPEGLLGAMPDHIDSPGLGPIAPDTATLSPPDCPFGGCPSSWLDPLPSSGGRFDDWHEGMAIAFYLLGGPWPISIPLGGSSTPDIPLGLLRPDEVEFSHESTFASRVAKAKGFYEWSRTGAVRDTIRLRAERYAQRLGPCECTSFGYSHSGTEYGWLIDEDDLSGLIHLCHGPDDDYCNLHYTVRCCVKKACEDAKFVGERVCRVRFDMKDKYSIDAWPEVSWIGRPFWHIIHFDKTLNETFPLDSP